MKVVILAGGVGTRLSEETDVRPKPMVEIGHRPILWHIMKHYSYYGFDDFVICVGYKGEQIKRYFTEAASTVNDFTVDFATGAIEHHRSNVPPWRVTVVDTGLDSQTAGRLMKVRDHLGDEPFMMTYGDGVANVDLRSLADFHRDHGKLATVTAVHPRARFGQLRLDGNVVERFDEKPQMDEGWINGGYFVLEPKIFEYIPGDVDWAREPLEKLASDGQLVANRHEGFWQCMDMLRDKLLLESLWDSGSPPWRVWES
ncbi:glucose-1-phosphate cytidylyltransferase [Ilumatobacter nonamiensis]|uniref:glucose-1-phosphate cytidylyltransferase n=1 Tax=Ilumatobacter nonamiensis TaxID=467093 RepID=UPI00034C7A01|nr:glucose-1-phosphate cytidylyltransferase [Ilumatobacter nonamiensis]